MFMYCNALIVLIGDKIAHNQKELLSKLPKLTSIVILTIYFFLMLGMVLFQNESLHFFSNDSLLITRASKYLLLICLVESTRPIYEVNKYSLQALGFEKVTLTITISVVMALIFAVLLLISSNNLNFTNTLFLFGIFNLVSGKFFSLYYQRHLNDFV